MRTEPRGGILEVLLVHEEDGAWRVVDEILRRLGHHVQTDQGANEPDLVVAVETHVHARTGCPVVAFLSHAADEQLRSAAYSGVGAHVLGADQTAWPKSIEVALRPFVRAHELEFALQRRAVIERAKGVLMERRGVRDRDAFELLRREARNTNRRVIDVAAAVLDGHLFLPRSEREAQGFAVELSSR